MKPIKYTYASPKRKRSIELPRSQNSSSPPPISVSTVDKPEITVRKVLKRSLSADSDVVERLLKKRKQEFDTVDQINLVEENRHFAIEYGKEDLTEETKGPFWNDLPLELFSKVAELLPHSDIVTLATACRSSSVLLQMEELWKRFYFEYKWKIDEHIKEQAELKNNGPPEQDADQANFWRSKFKQTHAKEWMKERTKTPVRTYSKRFQIISPAKTRPLSRSTSDLTQQ